MQPCLFCPYCNEPLLIEFCDEETQLIQSLDCKNCGTKVDLSTLGSEIPGEPTLLELVTSEQDFPEPAMPEQAASEQASTEALDANETQANLELASWATLSHGAMRPKRKEVSIFRKVIPPVLGGLAAFPIATAIMWYGLGKDLGSTAPFVAKYIPAIVPSHLQSGRFASQEPVRRKPSTPPKVPTNLPKLSAETPKPKQPSDSGAPTDLPRKGLASADLAPTQPTVLPSSTAPSLAEETKENAALALKVPSISTQIAVLRSLQQEWYSVPKAKRGAMIAAYYGSAKQLAQQTESLSGPAATVWRRELESLSREILKDKNCKTVMQLGPLGKIPGIKAATLGDYVVTVLTLDNSEQPKPTWLFGDKKIPVQLRPGAWKNGSATTPTDCLIFGKLVESQVADPAMTAEPDNPGEANEDASIGQSSGLELLVFFALAP